MNSHCGQRFIRIRQVKESEFLAAAEEVYELALLDELLSKANYVSVILSLLL